MSVDLAGFFGVVLLAYLVPGPDFLVVVRAAARRASLGRAAALGAQTGLCVHMCAAALGLSVIAARSDYAFTVIKLVGAAYLVHLGVRALFEARKNAVGWSRPAKREEIAFNGHGPRDESTESVSGGRRGSFLQGLLTNVLNPKAALVFLSILPQFVHRGGSSLTEQVFLLGTLDVLIGVVYWFALVGVAARLRAVLARPAWRGSPAACSSSSASGWQRSNEGQRLPGGRQQLWGITAGVLRSARVRLVAKIAGPP